MIRHLVLATAVLLLGSACGGDGDTANPADGVDLDDRGALLELELPTFEEDTTFRLGDRRGEPVVIDFFASWCTPCVREMPDIETVKQEVGDQVRFVGINVQDSVEAGRELIEQTGITWEVARDPDGELLVPAAVRGITTTLLLDADGQVLEDHTGALAADDLRQIISEHFDVDSEGTP